VQEAIRRFGADGGSIINLALSSARIGGGSSAIRFHEGAIETLTWDWPLELAPARFASRDRSRSYGNGRQCSRGGPLRCAGRRSGRERRRSAARRVTDIAPWRCPSGRRISLVTGEVIRAAGGLVVPPEALTPKKTHSGERSQARQRGESYATSR